jgi:hypothetical protein
MTFLGVFGALLGLLAYRFAVIDRTRGRVAVFVLAYLLHLGTTVAYYLYAQSNVSDAAGYYYDELDFAAQGFGLGTLFVVWIVQGLKTTIGGTFLDFFLLFQAFGFFGICALMRVFEELHESIGVAQHPAIFALLFLPGLHFWTSAIGKDGPLFCAVCLALWAAIDLRRRYLIMAVAILLMLLFRPHIALIGAAAVAGTLLFDKQTGFRARVLLTAASLAGLVVAVSTIKSTMYIDVTNADSVSDFLSRHEEVTKNADEAGESAVYGGYLFRLFSLWFRPLFLDAQGLFGLIASLENVVILYVAAAVLINFRTIIAVAKTEPFMRYALLLMLGVSTLLSLVYYNVGLGLRQKTMFIPAVLVMFTIAMIVRRKRIEASAGTPAAAHPPSRQGLPAPR